MTTTNLELRIACTPERIAEIADFLEEQMHVTVTYLIDDNALVVSPLNDEYGVLFLQFLGANAHKFV